MATARSTATTVASTTPRTASFVVVHMAGQRLARSCHVELTTSHGPGSTIVLTESQLVTASHAITTAMSTSAGGQTWRRRRRMPSAGRRRAASSRPPASVPWADVVVETFTQLRLSARESVCCFYDRCCALLPQPADRKADQVHAKLPRTNKRLL